MGGPSQMDIHPPKPAGKRVRQPPAFHIVFVTDTTASATAVHPALRPPIASQDVHIARKAVGKRKRPSDVTTIQVNVAERTRSRPPPPSLSSLPPVTPYSFLPDNKDEFSNIRSYQGYQQQQHFQHFQHFQHQDFSPQPAHSPGTAKAAALPPETRIPLSRTEQHRIGLVHEVRMQQIATPCQIGSSLSLASPPSPPFSAITDANASQQDRQQEGGGGPSNNRSNSSANNIDDGHTDPPWWEFE